MQSYRSHISQPSIPNNDIPSMSYSNSQREPIIIQGDGNVTIFGLNNHFKTDMPNKLASVLARDEYKHTIHKINRVLRKKMSYNIKLLFCGCLCFCCTLGMSACPSVVLNSRIKRQIRDVLDKENMRIYNQMGLSWSLVKQNFGTIPLLEYVLQIDFINKPKVYVPD